MLACPVCATPERDGRGRTNFEELYRLANGLSWLCCLACGEGFTTDEAAVICTGERRMAAGRALSDGDGLAGGRLVV